MKRSYLSSLVLGIVATGISPMFAQQPAPGVQETKSLEARKGAAEPPGESASAIRLATSRAQMRSSVRDLSALPPVPKGQVSLLGGVVQSVDHVRDSLVLKASQGKRMALLFDERTEISRGGSAGSVDDIQPGQQVYVDSMLDGTDVFARKIAIGSHGKGDEGTVSGHGSGQVQGFREVSGELLIRDSIIPNAVTMHLSSDAVIRQGERVAKPAELLFGTLVNFSFVPGADGPVVKEISILATPGSDYTFAGTVVDLDLEKGLLVLEAASSHTTSDVFFDPAARQLTQGLTVGANVTARTQFDGRQYRVREITVTPAAAR